MRKKGGFLAIIAARSGSKGLPGKNLRLLGGKPLVAWPVSAAVGCKSVTRVIVSTDSREIADAAQDAGAEVPFLRPSHLAEDNSSSMDVIVHAIEQLASNGDSYEHVMLLEPTSPLTESEDIDDAYNRLVENSDLADSIVGISKVEAQHPAYDVKKDRDDLISPYMHQNFSRLPRRQELEELYFLEGSLYISRVDSFIAKRSFYHDRTMGYLVPRWKAQEIDNLFDFYVVDTIMRHQSLLASN